jgi:hypothetical protein
VTSRTGKANSSSAAVFIGESGSGRNTRTMEMQIIDLISLSRIHPLFQDQIFLVSSLYGYFPI